VKFGCFLAGLAVDDQTETTLALFGIHSQKLICFTQVTCQHINVVKGALETIWNLQEAGSTLLTFIVEIVSIRAGFTSDGKGAIGRTPITVINSPRALTTLFCIKIEARCTLNASRISIITAGAIGSIARCHINLPT